MLVDNLDQWLVGAGDQLYMSPEGPERPVVGARFSRVRLPWVLGRWVLGLFIALAFAPGLAILFGALIVGPDKRVAFIGLWFMGVAALIAVAATRTAEEVLLTGNRISWRGYFIAGDEPLSALRAVRRATWPLVGVTFEVDGHGRFEVMPARGMRDFIDALQRLAPWLPNHLPRSALWGGAFYGRAKVTVVHSDGAPDVET